MNLVITSLLGKLSVANNKVITIINATVNTEEKFVDLLSKQLLDF